MSSVSQSTKATLNVFVTGATGNTGVATINHLLSLKSSTNVAITAAVRNIDKAKKQFPQTDKRLTFVTYDVKGDSVTGDKTRDNTVLKGFDTIVVIPPGPTDDRVGVSLAYINAAKAAGVKHIVLISAPAATKPKELIFGGEFSPVEESVRKSGIPFTILQAVFFYENQFMNVPTIKGNGQFYTPSKSNVPIPQISVSDIGEATAATVLAGPQSSAHSNKTIVIAGELLSWDSVATIFSKLIGKTVQFYPATDEQAIQAMTGMGLPSNAAKGIVELNRDFEKTGHSYSTIPLTQLLGHSPQSFEQWLSPRIAAFKN